MNKEIEARFINLSHQEIEEKLTTLNAQKIGSYFFQEWIFAYPEWAKDSRRLRVRTDGETTWLTYKANATWEVDSTEEVETEVSSAEEITKIIKAIGIPLLRYQEKKRIAYVINGIKFDLDFWPKIPMVLEIESSSEEQVREGAKLLNLKWEDAIFLDLQLLHREYYNIDLREVKDYRFEV